MDPEGLQIGKHSFNCFLIRLEITYLFTSSSYSER